MNVYQRYLARGDKTYYARFRYKGQAYLRKTSAHTKENAMKQCRALHALVAAGRWDELDGHKLRQAAGAVTLGQIIEAYQAGARGLQARSRTNNIHALQVLLRAVHGSAATPEQLRALDASVLDADLVPAYQGQLLDAAGADQLRIDRACVTANSNTRQARSLFAKKIRRLYAPLALPGATPSNPVAGLAGFLEARLLEEPRHSYQVPPAALFTRTMAAAVELRAQDSAAYQAFLLAYGLGLRKNEILHARWDWVDEHDGRHVLDVRTTADFRPKGKDDRRLPMEAHVHRELTALRIPLLDPAAPDYLLPGEKNRQAIFRRLSAWLRRLGWTTQKTTHEMRKLFGSKIAQEFGLFAAQKLLGHKDPNVTSRYYAGLIDLPEVKLFA